MYLFLHANECRGVPWYCFTFHNVSISTNKSEMQEIENKTLHSTMYLFLHKSIRLIELFAGIFTFHNVSISTDSSTILLSLSSAFTFHNVSISTRTVCNPWWWVGSLHSTMYLFLHCPPYHPNVENHSFTFHNVSISTSVKLPFYALPFFFTFHNVSISTPP